MVVKLEIVMFRYKVRRSEMVKFMFGFGLVVVFLNRVTFRYLFRDC